MHVRAGSLANGWESHVLDMAGYQLRQALRDAATTKPHPNPRVGARVVSAAGQVVGTGIHRAPGSPHAEIEALAVAGSAAEGGTLYVTLEPCDHVGRTPPCTEAIVAAGIGRVVIGARDPDPQSGSGAERLQGVGIDVIMSGLDSEVEALDPAYFHHRRTGRPLVTLKAALTLDGQLAARDGTSQWITSEAVRRDAHRLRAEADAVVVGAGTALTDDPSLTVRLPGYAAHQPVPVVVGGRRPIPNNLQIFARDALVFAPVRQSLDAEVVILPAGDGVDLEKMILALGERGLLALMVEGGAALASALLRAELIDRAVLYYGAKLAGGTGRALFAGEFETFSSGREVEIAGVATVGPDVRLDVNLKARQ